MADYQTIKKEEIKRKFFREKRKSKQNDLTRKPNHFQMNILRLFLLSSLFVFLCFFFFPLVVACDRRRYEKFNETRTKNLISMPKLRKVIHLSCVSENMRKGAFSFLICGFYGEQVIW